MGPHESSMSPDESNMSLQADDGVLGDGRGRTDERTSAEPQQAQRVDGS